MKNAGDAATAVAAESQRAPDARFREITSLAVRHLRAFARAARLTEAGFQQACAVVAGLG